MFQTILNFFFPQKCLGCRAENEILCLECLDKIRRSGMPSEKNVFAASDYSDDTVKKAIWFLKYKNGKQLAAPLAELIKRRVWPKLKIKNPLIVPIPLSKKKKRKRGYNQAELIAAKIDGELATNILRKKIHTQSQVELKDREKRQLNVIGSFEISNPEKIKGRNVVLIDDVCTTGATIAEARKILKKAGAKKIMAAVVARG